MKLFKFQKGRPGISGGDAETSDDETPRSVIIFERFNRNSLFFIKPKFYVISQIYYSIDALTGIWPFMSTNFHTMKPDEEVNASPSGEGPTTSTVIFCIL